MNGWAHELKRLGLDPRLTPARPDLAADSLKGIVNAPGYATGTIRRVAVAQTSLWRAPQTDRGLETELLLGERFTVYEEREGWAWGQALLDDYVGYLAADALAPDVGPAPTHKVAVTRTLVFPGPDLKLTPVTALSREARVTVVSEDGNSFARLASGAFAVARHVVPVAARAESAAAVALDFVGAPYLWGGRTGLGIDCSGLIQIAFAAKGVALPRDADLQAKVAAAALPAIGALGPDDLVFWDGHVGVMLDATRLIHANAFHRAVAVEPLVDAVARIAAAMGPVTALRRLTPSSPVAAAPPPA